MKGDAAKLRKLRALKARVLLDGGARFTVTDAEVSKGGRAMIYTPHWSRCQACSTWYWRGTADVRCARCFPVPRYFDMVFSTLRPAPASDAGVRLPRWAHT